LRGARNFAYLNDMSQMLRSVRLASGLPRDVFKQPVSKATLTKNSKGGLGPLQIADKADNGDQEGRRLLRKRYQHDLFSLKERTQLI
jgi:hypothetical protein